MKHMSMLHHLSMTIRITELPAPILGEELIVCKSKRLRPHFASFCAVGMLFLLSGCEKLTLDWQMEDLCRKDGGVKVYETVTLPPEMFDQWGDPFPGWRGRKLEDRLGPEYRYVHETIFLKQGDPFKGEGRLDRSSVRIFRRADGKLLGEAVSYGRSGGDFIAFAHPTSTHCPVYKTDKEWVIKSVFLKKGA